MFFTGFTESVSDWWTVPRKPQRATSQVWLNMTMFCGHTWWNAVSPVRFCLLSLQQELSDQSQSDSFPAVQPNCECQHSPVLKIKGTCLDPALRRQKQCATVCTQLPGTAVELSQVVCAMESRQLCWWLEPVLYDTLLSPVCSHNMVEKKMCWFVRNILFTIVLC